MSWDVKGPVVVPYDFSDHARQAVVWAVNIAGSPSRIHVLHVLPYIIPTDPGAIWDEIDDDGRIKHAKSALEEALPESQFGKLQFDVKLGDPGKVVSERAEELQADLVVLGSHGRTGVSRLLLGSVAERVTRLVHCPVLVVKLPAQTEKAKDAAPVQVAPA